MNIFKKFRNHLNENEQEYFLYIGSKEKIESILNKIGIDYSITNFEDGINRVLEYTFKIELDNIEHILTLLKTYSGLSVARNGVVYDYDQMVKDRRAPLIVDDEEDD